MNNYHFFKHSSNEDSDFIKGLPKGQWIILDGMNHLNDIK